jgi:kynurenine formamidase
MEEYRLLSYPLNEKTPLYGDAKPLNITNERQIRKGNSCNTCMVSIFNHAGTHIDAPKHFVESGRSLSEYSINDFIFASPCVIECPKKDAELVLPEDLKLTDNKCDILLVRTGFYRYRGEGRYRTHNPGISPEAAEWLRVKHPHIRAVGLDTISVSSFQNRDAGRKTHQIFLKNDGYPGDPMLLIEDLNLSGEIRNLKKVYAIPLFIEGVDSMSSTVVGFFNGN